jgi:hypothetical protein
MRIKIQHRKSTQNEDYHLQVNIIFFHVRLVDFDYLFTISDSFKKQSPSRGSASSTERDGKHQKDYSKSENKKTIISDRYDSSEEESSGYTGGSYSTLSKGKNNFEKDPYQTDSSTRFSKRNQSRSPSPKENIRGRSPDGMYSNT